MKVYEALARAFAAEGVKDVFGLMGDANMEWIDSLDKLGVNIYEVRHENAGVSMAQAYARVSGGVGVATATCGPGITQVSTSMTIANRSSTPLVMFAGESPTGNEDYIQRINQERFAAAAEAGFERAHSSGLALEALRKTFFRAKVESRPYMLSVPIDVQNQNIDDDAMDDYVPTSQTLQFRRVMPSPEDIAEAADMILASEKPVLLVGRGAMYSDAADEILAFADRIGALLVTTLMAKNWLNHYPYHAGISGTYATRNVIELIQDADLVIAVGAGLNTYTTSAGYLYGNAKIIHLDTARQVMVGGGGTVSMFLQSDAKLGIAALDAELASRDHESTGFHTKDVQLALASALDDKQTYDLHPNTMDPREVCLTLDEVLPSRIGLILGGGHQTGFSTVLCTKARDLLLPNQFFGSIGQALSTAIGAVVGSGKRPSCVFDGDASLMMYLSEFETAVRYDLPLLVVILNDQGLGSEYHKMTAHHHDSNLARLSTPDLGQVGKALGGGGALATSIDGFRAALGEWLAHPKPTLLDVRTSPNVPTISMRRLHYGEDA